jgi:hypothetical protein
MEAEYYALKVFQCLRFLGFCSFFDEVHLEFLHEFSLVYGAELFGLGFLVGMNIDLLFIMGVG